MSKIKRGICALCGETGVVTREHAPPKNLFLKPRPSNTITVPVCEVCNHSYHLDDEYFRVYVAGGAEPGTRLWRLWKEKVVGSSFVRSGGLKGSLADDRAMLLAHHDHEPIRTFDDDVVDDGLLHLLQSFNAARINAVVDKIIRCLHFSRTDAPLPSTFSLKMDIAPLTKLETENLYDRRTGCVGHHDEFVFRYEQISDLSFRWLLGFYRHHTFTVYGNTST